MDTNRNQPKIENILIDINKDKKETIKEKIKNITKRDFQKIETKKDGNCMFYAILKSIKNSEYIHKELRQIAADFVESLDINNENAVFQEEGVSSKKEYVNKIRKDGVFTNGIVLDAITKKTYIIFGIYKSDERYKNSPWNIIEVGDNEICKGVILLHFEQGESSKGVGHYSGIKLFNRHFLGNISFKDFIKANRTLNNNNQINEDIQMMNKEELNVLIFNCRSIREYYKKLLLVDILRSKDIDIALLQETYLIKEDELYIEGFKIYRGDNQIRRKGTAVMINTKLDVDCTKIADDMNGRFVMVRIKNRKNLNSVNIASVYLEPKGYIEDINERVLEADILGGDMNEAKTNFNKYNVFHLNNIDIMDEKN